jgi:hypothetical protein
LARSRRSGGNASKIREVEDRIIAVDEVDPYTRVMVQAPNKKGKTVFGASLPGTLIIDVNEKGTKSVRHAEGVHVFQAQNWADVVYSYWYLRASVRGDTKRKFTAYCLDTVTQMQHVCMKQVLGENADRDPYKDAQTPVQRDWLKMAELMKPQILNFRNLPMHGVFLVQERAVEDEDGESIMVPDLSPGCRGTLLAAVDVIGRMFVKEVRVVQKGAKKESKKKVHYMLTAPHDKYPTGTRLSLPPLVRNPTMQMFIDADRKDDE